MTRGSRIEEAFLDKNLKPSFKSSCTSVGVWLCYCGNEMGPLVFIEKGGTMIAKEYIKTLKITLFHSTEECTGNIALKWSYKRTIHLSIRLIS